MEKDYIPALFGFIGVIVGGFIASISKYIELKHQTNKEKNNLTLSKLEELHEKLSLFIQDIGKFDTNNIQITVNNTINIPKYLVALDDLSSKFFLINTTLKLYCPESSVLWNRAVTTFTNYMNACSGLLTNESKDINAVNSHRADLISVSISMLEIVEKTHNSFFDKANKI